RFVRQIRSAPCNSAVNLWNDFPTCGRGSEVTLTQFRWQSSKCSLSINAPLGRADRSGTHIACINFNRHAIEPTGPVERYSDCDGLLTGGASSAPNPERLFICPRKMRNEQAHKRSNLIDLTPKIGFTNGNRVQQVQPLTARLGFVFQKIVEVDQRIEILLNDQIRYLVHHEIQTALIEINACPFTNQIPYEHRGCVSSRAVPWFHPPLPLNSLWRGFSDSGIRIILSTVHKFLLWVKATKLSNCEHSRQSHFGSIVIQRSTQNGRCFGMFHSA